jgi:hypothetical protein
MPCPHRRSPALPALIRRSILVVLVAGLGLSISSAQPRSVSSRAAPERDFRLFVGVDLKVMQNGEMCRINDFNNRRALIESPERTEIADRDLGSIQFVHTTKLSRHPIKIAEMDVRKGISATTDERLERMVGQNNLQTYDQDRLQQLELSVISAAAFGAGAPQSTTGGAGAGRTLDDPGLRQAVGQLQDYQESNRLTSDSAFFSQQERDQDPDKFNTIILSAMVSSPVPVSDTYVVGIARIRTKESRSRDIVIFHEIGDLSPEPRQINIQKPGMPPGFEVLDMDLHVFREGQELVSDLSDKQFALTRDEAIEYLALERISAHRGQTLPAEPAWALAPSALLGSNRPEDFDYPLTVHVDERGRVTKIDESTIAPAPIPEIVSDLLFLPAIQSGETVATITNVNLSDFFR